MGELAKQVLRSYDFLRNAEILGMCDRIFVMSDGRVTGDTDRSLANQSVYSNSPCASTLPFARCLRRNEQHAKSTGFRTSEADHKFPGNYALVLVLASGDLRVYPASEPYVSPAKTIEDMLKNYSTTITLSLGMMCVLP
jgi:ABC-type sulfate/molybdate transport systems ATPase subunit